MLARVMSDPQHRHLQLLRVQGKINSLILPSLRVRQALDSTAQCLLRSSLTWSEGEQCTASHLFPSPSPSPSPKNDRKYHFSPSSPLSDSSLVFLHPLSQIHGLFSFNYYCFTQTEISSLIYHCLLTHFGVFLLSQLNNKNLRNAVNPSVIHALYTIIGHTQSLKHE